jgi:2-polyprenyl-3-methyl-5-hydroxy-6-metoxy-1,4-benzoquinol methylase
MWHKLKRAFDSRIIKHFGRVSDKQRIWDREFAGGQWNYLDDTRADPIYNTLAKYSAGGSILDLGCGSGNTGNEMDPDSYHRYTGTDLSMVAVAKATRRSLENHQSRQNRYLCAPIESFVPSERYDLILFRESIFYVPVPQIKSVLDRYTHYLKSPESVIIVRICDRHKYRAILEIIETHYQVVEEYNPEEASVIIVFKPFGSAVSSWNSSVRNSPMEGQRRKASLPILRREGQRGSTHPQTRLKIKRWAEILTVLVLANLLNRV